MAIFCCSNITNMMELLYIAVMLTVAFIVMCHVYAVTSDFNTQACPPISFSITSSNMTSQLSKILSFVVLVLVAVTYINVRSPIGIAVVAMAVLAVAVSISPMSSNHTEVQKRTANIHSRIHGGAAFLFTLCAFAVMVRCMHSAIHIVPVCSFAILIILFTALTFRNSSCRTFPNSGFLGYIEYIMIILFAWVVGDNFSVHNCQNRNGLRGH